MDSERLERSPENMNCPKKDRQINWLLLEPYFQSLHKLFHISVSVKIPDGTIAVSAGCLDSIDDPLRSAAEPMVLDGQCEGLLVISGFWPKGVLPDDGFGNTSALCPDNVSGDPCCDADFLPVYPSWKVQEIAVHACETSCRLLSVFLENVRLAGNLMTEFCGDAVSSKDEADPYRQLVENQSDLIVKTDLDGRILYANPAYCALFGMDSQDLIGKAYSPMVYEEDLPVVARAVSDMFNPPYQCMYEERAKTIYGWRWLQWTGKAIFGKDRNIVALAGSGRDITESKTLETERMLREAQQSAMFDNILDVIIITDENLLIRYVSSNIQKIFGWERKDILGQAAFRRLPEKDRERCLAMLASIKGKENATVSGQFLYRTKDGSMKNVEIMAVNLLHDSSINGLLINFHDITGYMQREEKILYLSYRDILTGLYNRAFYEEKIREFSQQEVFPLSVIMGDVNGLKLVNDGFGHAEGDKLLRQLADILCSCCRDNDIICRIGGDEFCIFLPEADHALTQQICNDIYTKCMQKSKKRNGYIGLSLSLGYETRTDRSVSIPDIIIRAESFMYRHKLLESRSAYGSLISSIRATMYEKSLETLHHQERIVEMTLTLGRKLGLEEEKLNQLELLAILHDIGKMSIDRRILNKNSNLTENEWLEVRKHPEAGYRISLASPELIHISDCILYHHEHWDGSGYPQGLKGEAIPFLSRIVAVVDAYDAIINDRSYRKARPKEYALEEIRRNSGIQFDPRVAEAFLELYS